MLLQRFPASYETVASTKARPAAHDDSTAAASDQIAAVVHSGFAAGDQIATGMFMRDLALAGACLMIYHFGSGLMSLDARGEA